jgi:hypothetical protein
MNFINNLKKYFIYAIPIVYALIVFLLFDLNPRVTADSVGYIEFSPVRTLGYPILIYFLGLDLLVPIQIIIFSLSLGWLIHEINEIIKNVYIISFVSILICLTPELIDMQVSVLTESFFTSLIIIIIIGIIKYSINPRISYLILISFVVGVSASIRPVAYGLVPVILFFILFNSKTKNKLLISLICMMLPCLLIITFERMAANIIFKDKIDSLLPRHLFAKSSMIDGYMKPLSSEKNKLQLKLLDIQNKDAENIRKFIANAPSTEVKNVLTLYYEQCIQYRCFDDQIYINNELTRAEENKIILKTSLERMINNPISTMELFIIHYKSLWTMYQARHPNVYNAFNDYIKNTENIPFDKFIFKTMPKKFSINKASYYLQIVFILTGVITFLIASLYLLFGFFAIKISPYFSISGILALIIHVEFCFTAFFGLGISRYSFVFFPAIFVSILFFLYGCQSYFLIKKNNS